MGHVSTQSGESHASLKAKTSTSSTAGTWNKEDVSTYIVGGDSRNAKWMIRRELARGAPSLTSSGTSLPLRKRAANPDVSGRLAFLLPIDAIHTLPSGAATTPGPVVCSSTEICRAVPSGEMRSTDGDASWPTMTWPSPSAAQLTGFGSASYRTPPCAYMSGSYASGSTCQAAYALEKFETGLLMSFNSVQPCRLTTMVPFAASHSECGQLTVSLPISIGVFRTDMMR
mmetsp:Transcript_50774/g.116939  ORF Transcript_50774/g.116939 Transcript_50774/m.116939 type:complete len:228 (-) Transcript_50774:138-821(-)